jgi:hypothetical protein
MVILGLSGDTDKPKNLSLFQARIVSYLLHALDEMHIGHECWKNSRRDGAFLSGRRLPPARQEPLRRGEGPTG